MRGVGPRASGGAGPIQGVLPGHTLPQAGHGGTGTGGGNVAVHDAIEHWQRGVCQVARFTGIVIYRESPGAVRHIRSALLAGIGSARMLGCHGLRLCRFVWMKGVEQLLEASDVNRHGRLTRILFSVSTTKQPPQSAISAATVLMASSSA